MGQVKSTYSYQSKQDAFDRMRNQLEYYDIPLCYSKLKKQYFIFERPEKRRYIYCHLCSDCWETNIMNVYWNNTSVRHRFNTFYYTYSYTLILYANLNGSL